LNRKDPKDTKKATSLQQTASSVGMRSTATRRDNPAPSPEAGGWKPFLIFALLALGGSHVLVAGG